VAFHVSDAIAQPSIAAACVHRALPAAAVGAAIEHRRQVASDVICGFSARRERTTFDAVKFSRHLIVSIHRYRTSTRQKCQQHLRNLIFSHLAVEETFS